MYIKKLHFSPLYTEKECMQLKWTNALSTPQLAPPPLAIFLPQIGEACPWQSLWWHLERANTIIPSNRYRTVTRACCSTVHFCKFAVCSQRAKKALLFVLWFFFFALCQNEWDFSKKIHFPLLTLRNGRLTEWIWSSWQVDSATNAKSVSIHL